MRIANMRIADTPPPYTEVADTSNLTGQPVQTSLRGGYMRPSMPSESTSETLPSAAQDPYTGSRPIPPAQSLMDDDVLARRSDKMSAPQPFLRPLSTSSNMSSTYSLSSGSASSSSLDSIKSKDIEGADLGGIRSALLSFQLHATKDHLRASVRQFRDDLRSQRQISKKDSKELKKGYKTQKKEIKKEIKAVVKQVKATRKADRKMRKAERKSRRKEKRTEFRGDDRTKCPDERGLRAEDRVAEKAREAEGRASEKAARAHKRAGEAQAQEATAVGRARGRVAHERAKGWNGEAVATQRVQEIKAQVEAAE